MGLVQREQIALSVLATIVSANQDFYIIDAGSKTLSSDSGAHGSSGDQGFGEAYKLLTDGQLGPPLPLVRLSEEHGFVQRGSEDLKIGDKVRVFPNHACPVANLAKEVVIVDDGQVIDRWEVAARGCVL
jgi:D-serine deaminase-like pyridoxal phosphate-dependent protein